MSILDIRMLFTLSIDGKVISVWCPNKFTNNKEK